MGALQEGERFRAVAGLVEQEPAGVEEHEHELDQLHLGDVLLPPEVRVQRGEHGEQVVGVHDRVDERVHHRYEAVVRITRELKEEVRHDGHDRVVEDVQRCEESEGRARG